MTGAFWPGLILAVLAIVYWWRADGHAWLKAQLWAEECARRGICPQCELSYTHCSCFEDRGLL